MRATGSTTLRFVPIIDLAFVDPIFSSAFVSRNHGYMVFDTLYGVNYPPGGVAADGGGPYRGR